MKYLPLILLLFASHMLRAQIKKIDSLKHVLNEASSKKEKMAVLIPLNKLLISQSELKQSLPFFIEMASISKELGNFEIETRAYKYISECYIKEMDSTKAKKYAQKALHINDQIGNLKGYLLDINQLGRVYHNFQNYTKAAETYEKGIKKYEQGNSKEPYKVLSNIYSNLSSAYHKLGKIDESTNAALKGVSLAEKLNSPAQKSFGLYIVGYRYMELGNYKKAEKYFLQSLTYSDSVSLKIYTNMNHHGLGINYSKWGKFKKALRHNKIALQFFRNQGNKLYEFDVLNNTAVVYQKLNLPKKVILYGEQALKVAREIRHKLAINGAKQTLATAYLDLENYKKAEKYLLEISKDTLNIKLVSKSSKAAIYKNLSQVYKLKKNYRKSLIYYTKFKKLNDSIQKEKLDSKFEDVESKYQTEKKSNKILSQSLEIERNKKEKTQLALFLGMSSFTILFLFYLLYKRQKQLKEEKVKYSKEVNKLKTLELALEEESKKKNQNHKELKKHFHDFLEKKYDLKEKGVLLEYWVEQARGISEKEMFDKWSIGDEGIKSRRRRLYEKLKVVEDIDSTVRLSKSESVNIYWRNLLEFTK